MNIEPDMHNVIEGNRPRVTAVDTHSIDRRLPEGQILIEIWDDGEIHIAYRAQEYDSWPVGMWGILRQTSNSNDADQLDCG